MHSLFYVAIILISGLALGKLVSYVKLPSVTGYLIAGVLIGPSVLHIVPVETAKGLSIISEAALGFIAYSIGSEFSFSHLKEMGRGIFVITVLEALGAVICVDLAMIFIFKQPVTFSIILGAIAAATAPAATLMVVRQYKAKGPIVDTLLPVVAMDDAVGIMVFGISMSIAKSLSGSAEGASMIQTFLHPLIEIGLALGIGLVLGIILSFVSVKASGEDQLLSITIAAVFLAIGVAASFNVSSLLLCMVLGGTVTNIAPNSQRLISVVERFTPPVFVLFFTAAGIDLHLGVLREVGLIGVGYIFIRVIGKVIGASVGAKLAHSPHTVQKYLGYTLIPQAGVAIGLAMVAQTVLPDYGSEIRTIILAATVIYELVGPVITKTVLFKAGEAQLI